MFTSGRSLERAFRLKRIGGMDTVNDDGMSARLLEASRRICQRMAEEVVRRGLVSPNGMTDDQLRDEVFACLRSEFKDDNVLFIRDHTPDLLKRARAYRTEGDCYLACLLYATWAEHWINGLISTVGERRKLQPDETAQIIREAPLRAKLTWLLSLFGLPRIADRHRSSITRLMDLRNGFVHYKWMGRSEPADAQDEADLDRSLTNFEATVKYLQRYYSRVIFVGSKARLKRIV